MAAVEELECRSQKPVSALERMKWVRRIHVMVTL